MTTRNPFAAGGDPQGVPAPPVDEAGSGAEGGTVTRIRARVSPAADLACCKLPLTDLGNAERWRVRFGDDFRFCPEIGWFAWDGRRWALLSEERDKIPARVMQSVFLTVRAIRNEAHLVAATGAEPPEFFGSKASEARFHLVAERLRDEGQDAYLRHDDGGANALWLDGLSRMDFAVDLGKDKFFSTAIAAWAKTSEGSGKLKAVADLAKSFEAITIGPTAMDGDRMAINVLNGTLRLERRNVKRTAREIEEKTALRQAQGERGVVSEWRSEWTVKLHPHARGDLISKLAPVEYRPKKLCAAYDGFIERVQPDPHMRRFLHQWGGLSLTGDIGEHKMAFFHGGGRNGKGTWVELVAAIAGDYAGSVGVESLADTGGKRRGDQATPDLAELPGVRFLRVSEPEKGMAFNDGLVKQLTGGDPVKARFLNKGFFEFLPSFKITISGNNKPNVRDTSHGFWARMQLVPWAVTIPEDEIDRRLPEALREEASGVLNRLIEGLIDWRQNGLIVPEAVRMATRSYRDQSDDLGRFLAQCCWVSDADASLRVGAKDLFEVFEAWAEQGSGTKWSMKGFKKAMEDRGFEQKQSNGMKWLRIELRPGVSVERVKAGDLPDVPSSSEAVGRNDPSAADGSGGQAGGGAGGGASFDPDAPVPGWE
ncbi:DNA primase family protein [Aurantiacibacter luteus]|uniref:DNA primase family protein n=1 Tax=Aurantiacibacter luteus TaxID=1581420 RepID=UPI0006996DFB|nr:phage/plasmid primase, P4 family [Aurantiacibacter luteus]